MKNYKELIVWKKGIEIVKKVYLLSAALPKEEKYGMASQMTRSAISIPANMLKEVAEKVIKIMPVFYKLP